MPGPPIPIGGIPIFMPIPPGMLLPAPAEPIAPAPMLTPPPIIPPPDPPATAWRSNLLAIARFKDQATDDYRHVIVAALSQQVGNLLLVDQENHPHRHHLELFERRIGAVGQRLAFLVHIPIIEVLTFEHVRSR